MLGVRASACEFGGHNSTKTVCSCSVGQGWAQNASQFLCTPDVCSSPSPSSLTSLSLLHLLLSLSAPAALEYQLLVAGNYRELERKQMAVACSRMLRFVLSVTHSHCYLISLSQHTHRGLFAHPHSTEQVGEAVRTQEVAGMGTQARLGCEHGGGKSVPGHTQTRILPHGWLGCLPTAPRTPEPKSRSHCPYRLCSTSPQPSQGLSGGPRLPRRPGPAFVELGLIADNRSAGPADVRDGLGTEPISERNSSARLFRPRAAQRRPARA